MSNPVLVEIAQSAEEQSFAGASLALANYKHLVERVSDVFGDETKASLWLSRPNDDLAGETPIQLAMRNAYDPQILEPVLARIEHGIYF